MRTARKWLARFESEGIDHLPDRSIRPQSTCSSMDGKPAERIEALQRGRMHV